MAPGITQFGSPAAQVFSWNGIVAEGFADGVSISIEEDGEEYVDYVGTQGDVTFMQKHDRRATVILRLAESSPTNGLLSSARERARAGLPAAPLLCRDSFGGTYASANGVLQKSPKREIGKDIGVNEWVFRCDNLRRIDRAI